MPRTGGGLCTRSLKAGSPAIILCKLAFGFTCTKLPRTWSPHPHQVAYLEAVCDLDGDQRVSASEILAAFKQLREMGPRVARHEDAAVVAVLNRISDALARDQVCVCVWGGISVELCDAHPAIVCLCSCPLMCAAVCAGRRCRWFWVRHIHCSPWPFYHLKAAGVLFQQFSHFLPVLGHVGAAGRACRVPEG